MGGYATVGAIAALATFLLVPLVRRLSVRFGVMDLPDDLRTHEVPTPLLGGLAMLVGFLAGLFAAWRTRQFHEMFSASSEAIGVVIGAIVITVVGTLDDVIDMSPPAKVAGMVLSGGALYLLGVVMYHFRLPFAGLFVLSPDLVPLLTVIWVIGMANAINLIDGLDGLAAGVVAIGAGALFLYGDRLFRAGLIGGDNLGPLVAALTCGVCVGFLPWNFSPAKIFMGDGGALLLGLLLAANTMVVGGRVSEPFGGDTYFFLAPLFIPFVILAVPIGDTVFSIIRRTVRRTRVTIRDKGHLHHRLLELGHGPRRAVVILWSFTAIFSGLALVPAFFDGAWAFVPFAAAGIWTIGIALWHPDLRRERRAKRAVPRAVAEAPAAEAVATDRPEAFSDTALERPGVIRGI